MNKLFELTNGKKTYILGLTALVYALSGFILGHHTPEEAMAIGWAALTSMTIRHGIGY